MIKQYYRECIVVAQTVATSTLYTNIVVQNHLAMTYNSQKVLPPPPYTSLYLNDNHATDMHIYCGHHVTMIVVLL